MKTNSLDYLLSSLCITFLLLLAGFTTWTLTFDNPYHVVTDVVVFLLSYGLYTAGLLAFARKIRPYPTGVVSMDSADFAYWKLNAVLTDLAWKALAPFNLVFSTPVLYLLFGVRMGKQVALGGTVRDHPLVSIDDYATLGQDSVVVGHAITHDEIALEPIHIGKNALVGINCVVMPGVTLGDGAVLAPGAVALRGTHIGNYELWAGIPARKIKDLPRLEPE